MKKLGIILSMFMIVFASAWSEGWSKGLELGGGARFELVLGDMKEHETGNLGFNVDAAYPLPLGLPNEGLLSAVGLSAQTGVLFPVGKKSYIDSWWALDFALGAYVDLRINQTITVRPGVAFDIRLNSVKSEEKSVSGMFADYGAKIGADVLLDVLNNGALFKAGMDYLILPEKDSTCHYMAFSLGALYRFE